MMRWLMMSLVLGSAVGCATWPAEVWRPIILPEVRTIEYRDLDRFPATAIPANKPPHTVANPPPPSSHWHLSLDDAIRMSLENARVIRVLAGPSAVSSGKTIYDAAITQTGIDQAQARFDPALTHKQEWSRTNPPGASTDLADFSRSVITSNANDAYLSNLGLSKTNLLGGQTGLTWIENYVRHPGGGPIVNPLFPGLGLALNPQTTSALALSYTQPLLQGAGFRVNNAPIVIARLNTEISFFQYKDSVQEMVRGVVEAYWSLVQARTDVQARQEQVNLSKFSYERESARLDAGLANTGDVAQAKVAYTQFKASLIAAQANAL
ncbi:MAG: TolC family protein, partial [Planctomycetes bacterium]|nr:TolC family protein [Planctomycetota bacterium]